MLDINLPDDPELAAMVVHTRQLVLDSGDDTALPLFYGRGDDQGAQIRIDYTDGEQLAALSGWLESHVRGESAFAPLLGSDAVFLHALALAQQQATKAKNLADLAPILIQGPTGSGKELLARAIHEASGLTGKFVPVHCAGITEDLLQNTLFGHMPNSFTGAGPKEKRGLIDEAKGGTLFLDELGDLPLRAQIILLRFLEDQRYRRVGGTQEIQANVRVVCATWKDLDDMVEDGDFRDDLFYRLAGARIAIPGLAQRRHELIPVAEAMVRRAGADLERPMDDQVRLVLVHTRWPGGFRQLDMELREAVRQAGPGPLRIRHLAPHRVADFHRRGQALRLAAEILAWSPDGATPDENTLERRASRAVELIRVASVSDDPEVGLLESVRTAFDENDRPHQLLGRVVELVGQEHVLLSERRTIEQLRGHLDGFDLEPLAARSAELQRLHAGVQEELEALSDEITARLPGLFQLFSVVHQLPGLGQSDKSKLFRSLATIVHFTMTLMPSFAAVGIKRLASSTFEELVLEDFEENDPNNPFLEAVKPERRPEDHWRWLANNTASLREAADVSGHSRNTVKTYYERYQLVSMPPAERSRDQEG